MPYQTIEKPKIRSPLRAKLGFMFYGTQRRFLWLLMNHRFAKSRSFEPLEHSVFTHKTPLMRKLKDVDMWLQENKVVNLRIAAERVNGIIIHPGETLSYWKLIGKPTARKGYLKGMVLKNGGFSAATGGGLCQLSNLIFWMTLHSPLTVTERHRHGYDVFPDSNRTQPFGSGATCYYPHGDLMIRNDTNCDFQLFVKVGDTHLEGEWRSAEKPEYTYKIVERNHEMKSEYWGGYSRHNELYRQRFDEKGEFLDEELVVKNSAIMMYSPFIEYKG